MKVLLENVEIKITRTGKNSFDIKSELPGISQSVNVREGDTVVFHLPNVLVEAERPFDLNVKGIIKL